MVKRTQTIRRRRSNSVFDHFDGSALNGLKLQRELKYQINMNQIIIINNNIQDLCINYCALFTYLYMSHITKNIFTDPHIK